MPKPKKKPTRAKKENAKTDMFLPFTDTYTEGLSQMKGLGETFRFDPEFRAFIRDYIYEVVTLCKNVAWKVVALDSSRTVTGTGLGSKTDMLWIANPLIAQLIPDIPTLYRIWRRMQEGYYEKMRETNET